MKNLEQIRAKNALEASNNGPFNGVNGGQIVKKIPTMILENGILATLAFALEKTDKGKYRNEDSKKVFDKIAKHLNDPENTVILSTKAKDAESMKYYLSQDEEVDSSILRAITSETNAFLNYFRRFAGKTGE